MASVATAAQTHHYSPARAGGGCSRRAPAPTSSSVLPRGLGGAPLPMADSAYSVMLGPGRTSVHTRQPGRSAAYSVWVGWQGDVSTHRHGDRTTSITGHWHFTILCRDRNRAPTVETVQMLTDLGDRMLPTLGELTIAGPSFVRPRHQDREYPAPYVVHVTTMAHGQLSTLMNRMEGLLRLEHVHRINFHLSIDVPPEDAWEIVD